VIGALVIDEDPQRRLRQEALDVEPRGGHALDDEPSF